MNVHDSHASSLDAGQRVVGSDNLHEWLERVKTLLRHPSEWQSPARDALSGESIDLSRWVIPPVIRAAVVQAGYTMVSLEGAGATSLVMRARRPGAAEDVAVKLVRPRPVGSSVYVEYERRIRQLQSLRHPNLVAIHEFHALPLGWTLVVMDYVDGDTLAQRIQRGGKLDPVTAARIVGDAVAGLAALHKAGFSHRDIKPSNILIDRADGRARLADFGLTRSVQSGCTVTSDASFPGTPRYMSPEQFSSSAYDLRRADIYSMGAVLYECVFGEPIVDGPLPTLIAQVLYHTPPRLRDAQGVPASFVRVIRRAIHRRPSRRYETAAEMAVALRRLTQQRSRRADALLAAAHDGMRLVLGPFFLAALFGVAAVSGHHVPIVQSASNSPSVVSFHPLGRPSSQPVAPPSGAEALQFVLAQNQVADPRPTARREQAAQVMLRIIDAMEQAAVSHSQAPRRAVANAAYSKARLLLDIGDVDQAERLAIKAATQADYLLDEHTRRGTHAAVAHSLEWRELLQLGTRAHRLAAELCSQRGRIVPARWHATEALNWSGRWRSSDPASLAARAEEARVAVCASYCIDRSDRLAAQTRLRRALAILDDLPESGDAEYVGEIAACFESVANAGRRLGYRTETLAAYEKAERWQLRRWPTAFDPSARYEAAAFYLEWAAYLHECGKSSEARRKLARADQAVAELIEQDGEYPEYTRLRSASAELAKELQRPGGATDSAEGGS